MIDIISNVREMKRLDDLDKFWSNTIWQRTAHDITWRRHAEASTQLRDLYGCLRMMIMIVAVTTTKACIQRLSSSMAAMANDKDQVQYRTGRLVSNWINTEAVLTELTFYRPTFEERHARFRLSVFIAVNMG